MQFGIRTLDEVSVRGKTVLCRIDINQPVDRCNGMLKSINRIKACVPTVRELSEKGAKVVLMAHQGSDEDGYPVEKGVLTVEQALRQLLPLLQEKEGRA